jgi:hypothetical protein
MSNPIIFSLDERKIELKDAVFTLLDGRERKISAAEQAVLLRIVHATGIADYVPANPPKSILAHLKHNKLVDRETERPTEDGQYIAGVLLGRSLAVE